MNRSLSHLVNATIDPANLTEYMLTLAYLAYFIEQIYSPVYKSTCRYRSLSYKVVIVLISQSSSSHLSPLHMFVLLSIWYCTFNNGPHLSECCVNVKCMYDRNIDIYTDIMTILQCTGTYLCHFCRFILAIFLNPYINVIWCYKSLNIQYHYLNYLCAKLIFSPTFRGFGT